MTPEAATATSSPHRVVIEVRIPTRGSQNARPGNWQAAHRHAKQERAAVLGAIQLYRFRGGACRPLPGAMAPGIHLDTPLAVRLVRVSPSWKPPDDDNLRGYLKHVRDELAAYYGVDDSDPRISWSYAAERGTWCVRIELEARS